MKKVVALGLALTMAGSLVGCAKESGDKADKKIAFKPGTYEGTGSGMFGDVVMSVTFSENEITKIEKVSSNETVKVTETAFKLMPERIIEEQSLKVDTVSSATFASRAIVMAVEDAAKQATEDISALKAELPAKQPGEKIEKTTDIVIVGAGGAGLSAAVSAVQNGANVIVIEKNEFGGGNTVASGGAWNAPDPELAATVDTKNGQIETLKKYLDMNEEDLGPAGPTLAVLKEQIREYLAGDTSKMFDSVELFTIQVYTGGKRQDLDGNELVGNFDLIKKFCENSLPTRNWVQEIGGSFSDRIVEPSGALWLRALYPGSDEEQLFSYVTNMENIIRDNGSEIMYGTSGQDLIIKDGAVKGIKAVQNDGTEVEINAESVIMATGGFASNVKMVEEYDNYWGKFTDNMKFTTLPSTVGDGIEMGVEANANLVGMEVAQLNKGYSKTGMHAAENGLQAMFLNKEGKRFVNEYAARDVFTRAAIEEGGLYYHLVNTPDAKDAHGPFDTYNFETVEEIAEKFGFDKDVLQAEIDKYNSYVEAGHDPDFGKNVFGNKIVGPYTVRVWVPVIHHTMGGLQINTDAQVLDTEGNVIEGLYAAGEVTGGLHGGNRLGGNAVADAFVFGKIAGENAANAVKK